jgi:hypothetical protein
MSLVSTDRRHVKLSRIFSLAAVIRLTYTLLGVSTFKKLFQSYDTSSSLAQAVCGTLQAVRAILSEINSISCHNLRKDASQVKDLKIQGD